MKINKRLKKDVYKLVKESLDQNGQVVENKVFRVTQKLSKLPSQNAITALTEYLKGVKREVNKTTLEIESTYPLNSEQMKKIKNVFGKQYFVGQTKVNLNPLLLGGIKIKISDWVYDDSLNRKIVKLGEEIHG